MPQNLEPHPAKYATGDHVELPPPTKPVANKSCFTVANKSCFRGVWHAPYMSKAGQPGSVQYVVCLLAAKADGVESQAYLGKWAQ